MAEQQAEARAGQVPWHRTGPHDDQCESEFITGPMAYTPCACRDRRAAAVANAIGV